MKLILFFAMVFLTTNLLAQQESSTQLFEKGVTSFKKKNYQESSTYFKQALNENNNPISSLYNLGLSQYQLGNLGKASAYWKKVLSIHPTHNFSRKSLQAIQGKIPSKNSFWNNFRSNVLNYFTLQSIAILFTVFLTGFFAALIKYSTGRHIALKNYLPLPSIPNTTWIFTIFFTLFSVLFFTKVYDHLNPRGVVIADVASIYLSPTEEDIKIRELSQGEELIIKKQEPHWLQIQTLSGNYGWIKKENLLHTSGALIQ